MAIEKLSDVEFGEDLPAFEPDTRLETSAKFAKLVGWDGGRFTDHEWLFALSEAVANQVGVALPIIAVPAEKPFDRGEVQSPFCNINAEVA